MMEKNSPAPVAITVEQVKNSLPPLGHGGSVPLVPLLVGRARFLVENPEQVLLPAELCEPGANTARVHVAQGEETCPLGSAGGERCDRVD